MNTIELDVNVIQRDIDEGEQANCNRCPGALAINRALAEFFGEGKYVSNVGGHVFVSEPNEHGELSSPIRFGCRSPQELEDLIDSVDCPRSTKQPPRPTRFHLSLHKWAGDWSQ